MTDELKVIGVLAEDGVSEELTVVETDEADMGVKVNWGGEEIAVRTTEQVFGVLVLVYLAEGWNTRLSHPEGSEDVKLLGYHKQGKSRVSQYVLLDVRGQGDIELESKSGEDYPLDFNDDGTLHAAEAEEELEDDDD